MEYITEERGGYDEWSEKYTLIVGLELDDGTEIRNRFIKGVFVDVDGYEVEVELPQDRDGNLYVERYNPEYEVWELPLSEFERCVDGKMFNPNRLG